jgi:hypothetical protein
MFLAYGRKEGNGGTQAWFLADQGRLGAVSVGRLFLWLLPRFELAKLLFHLPMLVHRRCDRYRVEELRCADA